MRRICESPTWAWLCDRGNLSRALSIVVMGSLGGWVGFNLADREPPIAYRSMTARPAVVYPGDVIRIEHKAIRFRSCQTRVIRYLFDSAGGRYVVPDLGFPARTLPIGDDEFTVTLLVDPKMAEGPAYYQATRQYRCNWTHYFWPIETGPFRAPFTVAHGRDPG
jgi:pimeloyl-ACP methyl ester carboxylesterase